MGGGQEQGFRQVCRPLFEVQGGQQAGTHLLDVAGLRQQHHLHVTAVRQVLQPVADRAVCRPEPNHLHHSQHAVNEGLADTGAVQGGGLPGNDERNLVTPARRPLAATATPQCEHRLGAALPCPQIHAGAGAFALHAGALHAGAFGAAAGPRWRRQAP